MVKVKLSQQADPVGYLLGVAARLRDCLAAVRSSRKPGVAAAYAAVAEELDQIDRDLGVAWGRLRLETVVAGKAAERGEDRSDRLTEAVAQATRACQAGLDITDRLVLEHGLKDYDLRLFLKIATVLRQQGGST